jgi:hypothetical protein
MVWWETTQGQKFCEPPRPVDLPVDGKYAAVKSPDSISQATRQLGRGRNWVCLDFQFRTH